MPPPITRPCTAVTTKTPSLVSSRKTSDTFLIFAETKPKSASANRLPLAPTQKCEPSPCRTTTFTSSAQALMKPIHKRRSSIIASESELNLSVSLIDITNTPSESLASSTSLVLALLSFFGRSDRNDVINNKAPSSDDAGRHRLTISSNPSFLF